MTEGVQTVVLQSAVDCIDGFFRSKRNFKKCYRRPTVINHVSGAQEKVKLDYQDSDKCIFWLKNIAHIMALA